MSKETLAEYVQRNTYRGECKCGKCIDVGNKNDPEGHTANMIFFKVAIEDTQNPTVNEFTELTNTHTGHYGEVDPLDGKEHGYMELGGWIGDQGLAMQYMGLGVLLGVFQLQTPITMLGLPEDNPMVMQMAGAGMVSVTAVTQTVESE